MGVVLKVSGVLKFFFQLVLIPLVIVRLAAARLDQPGRKTISTNRMLVGVPLYLIWYGVTGWWMAAQFDALLAVTWLIAAPICGIVAVHYWRRAGRTARLLWHQLRVTVRRGDLKRLRKEQAEVRESIQELAEEYAESISS